MTLPYFNILLFIQFLVYSSCIFDIDVIYDDYRYMIIKHLIQYSSELGGAHYVDVVSRYIVYLWRHPDVPYHMVAREGQLRWFLYSPPPIRRTSRARSRRR